MNFLESPLRIYLKTRISRQPCISSHKKCKKKEKEKERERKKKSKAKKNNML
jgi:hypothetical protein